MYDTTKAKAICSTATKGSSCQLRLTFPNTHYVILTTPNNVSLEPKLISHMINIWANLTNSSLQGDLLGWYIELSFVARVITYIGILGMNIRNITPFIDASSNTFLWMISFVSNFQGL